MSTVPKELPHPNNSKNMNQTEESFHEESFDKFITDKQLLELQGITYNANKLHILGLYAALCIIPLGLFHFWFNASICAFVLIWWGMQKELRGKESWIRALLLKNSGTNIISWFVQRLPEKPYTAPDSEPTIIWAFPRNIYASDKNLRWGIVATVILTSVLPFISSSPKILVFGAIFLLLICITCFAFPTPQRKPQQNSLSIHNLLYSCWHQQKRTHRMGILLYEAGFNGGGIPTFLQNYQEFIPPECSTIVFLEEGAKQLFVPKAFLGKKSFAPQILGIDNEEFSIAENTNEDIMNIVKAYGWNTITARIQFEETALQEVCTQIDSISYS